MMITGEQLRAARAMLRLDQGQLAEQAGISTETLKRFEASEGPIKGRADNIISLERVLRSHGVEFIFGDSSDDDKKSGFGVRFAEDRTKLLRRLIANLSKELTAAILTAAVKKDPHLFDKGADHVVELLNKDLPVLLRHTLPSRIKFMVGLDDDDLQEGEEEK
jgi:transcriptional regulator with XRE-family HTH domain